MKNSHMSQQESGIRSLSLAEASEVSGGGLGGWVKDRLGYGDGFESPISKRDAAKGAALSVLSPAAGAGYLIYKIGEGNGYNNNICQG